MQWLRSGKNLKELRNKKGITMSNKNQNFEEIVRKIANTKCSFGNNILYDMCKNKAGQDWTNPDVLADKMWLIGRSYAASPERRYINTNPENKIKFNVSGDGTNLFFNKTSEQILKKAVGNRNRIQNLTKKYRFDLSENDIDILTDSIMSVFDFNNLVINASSDFDLKVQNIENKDAIRYKNQISFCSKFLHFHFPFTVFIFDSFTFSNAKYLFSNRTKTDAFIEYGENSASLTINGSSKVANKFLSDADFDSFEKQIQNKLCDTSSEKYENAHKEYIKHCINAYKTGYLINEIIPVSEIECEYYTRAVDNLLLHIKKLVNNDIIIPRTEQ